tara:strand:- start:429 stop:752 length:324 start_codon:yes stop_codon:yes gene_type:complete
MKVNLSYSVELHEVLTSVEKLYNEARQKFEQNYNALTDINAPKFELAALEADIRNFGGTHRVMADFANKLEELQSILVGYHNVIQKETATASEPEGVMPAPEPEADE